MLILYLSMVGTVAQLTCDTQRQKYLLSVCPLTDDPRFSVKIKNSDLSLLFIELCIYPPNSSISLFRFLKSGLCQSFEMNVNQEKVLRNLYPCVQLTGCSWLEKSFTCSNFFMLFFPALRLVELDHQEWEQVPRKAAFTFWLLNKPCELVSFKA